MYHHFKIKILVIIILYLAFTINYYNYISYILCYNNDLVLILKIQFEFRNFLYYYNIPISLISDISICDNNYLLTYCLIINIYTEIYFFVLINSEIIIFKKKFLYNFTNK